MPKYQKYLAAMVNLAQASSRNPKIGHDMEDFGSLTSGQMVARLRKLVESLRARG
jgi:hypothetical protein